MVWTWWVDPSPQWNGSRGSHHQARSRRPSRATTRALLVVLLASLVLSGLPTPVAAATWDAEVTTIANRPHNWKMGDDQFMNIWVRNTGTSDPYDGYASFTVRAEVRVDGVTHKTFEGKIWDIEYQKEKNIRFNYEIDKPGRYSYYAEVWNIQNNVRYDTYGPVDQFNVAADDARITGFSPPSGTVKPGDSLRASVTVKNTGDTTRSFWVGLSYQKPDGSWYDVPPKRTSSLSPSNSNTVAFSYTLASNAPAGSYDAATAVWHGYNSGSNLMVEPRFEWVDVNGAFTVREVSDDARITGFSPPSGTVKPGDSLRASVTVKNTGDTTRSFWVGLSYQKPDGSWYDVSVEGTRTLEPGEEQTHTFSWSIPSDAPNGMYHAAAGVWDRVTDGSMHGAYERTSIEDAFGVHRHDQDPRHGPEPPEDVQAPKERKDQTPAPSGWTIHYGSPRQIAIDGKPYDVYPASPPSESGRYYGLAWVAFDDGELVTDPDLIGKLVLAANIDYYFFRPGEEHAAGLGKYQKALQDYQASGDIIDISDWVIDTSISAAEEFAIGCGIGAVKGAKIGIIGGPKGIVFVAITGCITFGKYFAMKEVGFNVMTEMYIAAYYLISDRPIEGLGDLKAFTNNVGKEWTNQAIDDTGVAIDLLRDHQRASDYEIAEAFWDAYVSAFANGMSGLDMQSLSEPDKKTFEGIKERVGVSLAEELTHQPIGAAIKAAEIFSPWEGFSDVLERRSEVIDKLNWRIVKEQENTFDLISLMVNEPIRSPESVVEVADVMNQRDARAVRGDSIHSQEQQGAQGETAVGAYIGGLNIGVEKLENKLTLTIESMRHEGRTLVFDLAETSLAWSDADHILVEIDGVHVDRISDIGSIMNPDPGSEAGYYPIKGENGLKILVYFPHFSTRILTIEKVAAAPTEPIEQPLDPTPPLPSEPVEPSLGHVEEPAAPPPRDARVAGEEDASSSSIWASPHLIILVLFGLSTLLVFTYHSVPMFRQRYGSTAHLKQLELELELDGMLAGVEPFPTEKIATDGQWPGLAAGFDLLFGPASPPPGPGSEGHDWAPGFSLLFGPHSSPSHDAYVEENWAAGFSILDDMACSTLASPDRCRHCATKFPPKAGFCVACGQKRDAVQVSAKCPQCNAKTRVGTNSCDLCRFSLRQAS